MLMIVAPLEQELAGLRRALRAYRQGLWGFRDTPLPLEIHAVGVGQTAVGKVKALLSAWKPWPYPGGDALDGLLLLGFAGSLVPFLSAGDLVLSTHYCRNDGGDSFQPDPRLFREAMAAAENTQQTSFCLDSVTVDHLVTTPREKQALAQRYGAGTVNMEDYWVAAAAQDAGVPFLSARAVLDVSTQCLPSYLLELPDSHAGAALSLAARPWRVPPSMRLARQSSVASAALARFALAFSRQASLALPSVLPSMGR